MVQHKEEKIFHGTVKMNVILPFTDDSNCILFIYSQQHTRATPTAIYAPDEVWGRDYSNLIVFA